MVVNELLCYAIYNHHSSASNNCKQILTHFYAEESVLDAKEILWENCGQHITKRFINCINSTNRTAKEANICDILEAIKELDAKSKLPDVFAKNLSQLPDRQPEELNLLRIVQRLSILEKAYDQQSNALATVVLDISDIKDKNIEITSSLGNNEDLVASSNENNDENDDDDHDNNNDVNDDNDDDDDEHDATHDTTDPATIVEVEATTPIQLITAAIATAPKTAAVLHAPKISGTRWGSEANNIIPRATRRMNNELDGDINNEYNRANEENVQQQNEGMQNGVNNIENEQNHGFIQVQNKKQRRLSYRNRESNGLQGAPVQKKAIFVYMVENGDINEVNDVLKDHNVQVLNNEKVSHNNALYKSFKVTISRFDVFKVLKHSFWPDGVQCKIWQESSSSRLPNIDYSQEY